MSKFLSACCCVIVGLELLIGVPVAVLAAYAYGAASVPVVMHSDAPVAVANTGYAPAAAEWKPVATAGAMSCCPTPAVEPPPLAFAPSTLPANPPPGHLPQPTYNPYVAPATPGVCPPPAVACLTATAVPVAPLPSDPAAAVRSNVPANVLAAAQVTDLHVVVNETSAASGPNPAAPTAEPTLRPEANPDLALRVADEPKDEVADPSDSAALVRIEDWQKLLADWQCLSSGDFAAVAAKICSSGQSPLACVGCREAGCHMAGCEGVDSESLACEAPPAESYTEQSLRNSLQRTVAELYAHAERAEGDGDFKRADHLRELARSLRVEIVECSLRQQVSQQIEPSRPADRSNVAY